MYSHGGAKNYFTMIWTCTNADLWDTNDDGEGDEYGYWETEQGTGRVGMPYAWTKTDSLSIDGYEDPINSHFCYIGFENISKPVTEYFQGGDYIYVDFIRNFYYHAVTEGQSINDALDQAVVDMDVYGVNSLGDSELYNGWDKYEMGQWWKCRMRVFGDGNNVLGVY
jgi:hypothetical protein